MGRPLPESVIVQEGDPDFEGAPTAMRLRLTYEGKLLGATLSEISSIPSAPALGQRVAPELTFDELPDLFPEGIERKGLGHQLHARPQKSVTQSGLLRIPSYKQHS